MNENICRAYTKKCSKCSEIKNLTDFHPSTSRGTHQSWCKICKSKDYLEKIESNRKKRKSWYEKSKDKVKNKQRLLRKDPTHNYEVNLKRRCRKKGITVEEYNSKYEELQGRCEICKNEFIQTCAIDHCHETGKFRSLLCDNCNTALGLLKEDLSRLESAKNYLIKYKN